MESQTENLFPRKFSTISFGCRATTASWFTIFSCSTAQL